MATGTSSSLPSNGERPDQLLYKEVGGGVVSLAIVCINHLQWGGGGPLDEPECTQCRPDTALDLGLP